MTRAMRALATKPRSHDGVLQDCGTVTRSDAGRLAVRTSSGVMEAERAVSCLVEPILGDQVLLACIDGGACFVLAILRREDASSPTCLSVDGGLTIAVPRGKLELSSRDGVTLSSPREVSLLASELVLTAARASTTLGELSHVGARILAQVDSVKVVGEVLEAVVDRAVSRVKRAFRFIDEADTVRAGSVDYRARGMASLQGEHATVTAEKLVKIDGAQIHVG